MRIWVPFRTVSFKKVFFFFSRFNPIKQEASLGFQMFSPIKSNIQIFFHSCIFPLPYIVIAEMCVSFFITDLVRTKFMLYRILIFCQYRFHENIDYIKTHIQPKNWCNFHIHQIKGRVIKRQLKMLGIIQKKTVKGRTVTRCGLSLVWRRRNQLLAG